MFEEKNLGVQILPLSPYTFTVQGVTGIQYFSNNTNWVSFEPTPELQWGTGGDKLNCITYATCQQYETDGNWKIATGTMPAKQLKFLQDNGYLDTNGKINFSERFSSILNGTTTNGNNAEAVYQGHHTFGLIPEALLPSDNSLTWAQYYDKTVITQAMYDLGLQFLQMFSMPYEAVAYGTSDLATLQKHIQQAPLVILTPICPVWGTDDPLKACSKTIPQHATLALKIDVTTTILDHYTPFIKNLAPDYPIEYAFKSFLQPITDAPAVPLSAKPFTLLKKNGANAMYFYGMDNMWHGLGDSDVRTTFSGVYVPANTIRVDTLPTNISFTVIKQ